MQRGSSKQQIQLPFEGRLYDVSVSSLKIQLKVGKLKNIISGGSTAQATLDLVSMFTIVHSTALLLGIGPIWAKFGSRDLTSMDITPSNQMLVL